MSTINIILDTRRIKKTNKYPVKLRITFERVTEYYQTIFDLSKDDYDKLSASRVSAELQTIRDKLKEIERAAERAWMDLDTFSFTDFEKNFILNNKLFRHRQMKPELVLETEDKFDKSLFIKKFPILLEERTKPGTISTAYLSYIKRLLKEGRISTAVNYHCSYISIKKFRGDVRFSEITPSYLTQFENWLISQSIYSRLQSECTCDHFVLCLMRQLRKASLKEKNVTPLEDVNTGYLPRRISRKPWI